jgi:serine protease AprX
VGNDEYGRVKPPANAPNVIFGWDSMMKTNWAIHPPNFYHSTFWQTEDDLAKPELIAPAIWIAAPILPKQKSSGGALLYEVMQTPREEMLHLPGKI